MAELIELFCVFSVLAGGLAAGWALGANWQLKKLIPKLRELETLDESGKWTADDEASSRAIYEQWANLCDYVPWVEGGNSMKQEEARRMHCAIEGRPYSYGR